MKTFKNWLATLALLAGLVGSRAEDVVTEATSTNSIAEIEAVAAHAEAVAEGRTSSGRRGHRRGAEETPIVSFGRNFTLRSNETAEVVVVIGGTAKIHGKVNEAVVAIAGDVETEGGEIGDAVVSVLGSSRIGKGTVVHGDVVSVGGGVEVDDAAHVDGDVQPVGLNLPELSWLKNWLLHCVFKLRPLAPQVGWVWIVFGAFFLFYLLVAVALPRPVQSCVDEITRRPATTFFMAILTALLLPIVLVVLAATGIGVVVIPFLLAAGFFAVLVGKVAFLEYLGQSLGRLFGATAIQPVLGLVIGSALLALLYMIPVLGLIVFAVTGLWGLGAAVTAGFGNLRRESAERPPKNGNPPPPATPAATPVAPMAASVATSVAPVSLDPVAPMVMEATPASPVSEVAELPPAAPTVGAGFFAGTTPVPPSPAPRAGGEAFTMPRASFWERMGAGLLDMILAGMLCGFAGGPPLGFILMLAYFAGMWTWKGTTVGGLVVNLKVVRLDDQPVTFVVALVRGLAAAFSALVLFLGFFWIAWDKERQGWHDMIAGTVVVRVPRGRSLV